MDRRAISDPALSIRSEKTQPNPRVESDGDGRKETDQNDHHEALLRLDETRHLTGQLQLKQFQEK